MEGLQSLGIDIKSIVFYIVNFGIIYLVINKYLSSPIINLLNKRKQEIKKNIELAESLKQQLKEQKEQSVKENRAFRKQLETEVEQIKNQLLVKEQNRLKEIENERALIINKAQQEAKEIKQSLIEEVKSEIVKITKLAFVNITKNNVSEEKVLQSVKSQINEYK